MRRLATALVLVAGILGALPAAASAHATLEGTQPGRGAVVKQAPKQAVFRFDETVEGNFGAVRVFDRDGKRVDQGDAFHVGGAGSKLGVHLKSGVPKGAYTATYRVVSADGHIVSGGFVFSVGHGGAGPGETVSELLGKSKTGPVTEVAFGVARALQYGAIAVALGALAFLVLVWLPALRRVAGGGDTWRQASQAFVLRLRRLVLAAALVGALSALAGTVLEAAEAAGVTGFGALRPHVLSEVLDTRFGAVWGTAAAYWLLLGGVASFSLRPSRSFAPVLRPASLGATGLAPGADERTLVGTLVLPALALVSLPALSGHGLTQSPVAVLLPSTILHVAAMSLWLGGLVTLVAVLPAATRRLVPADRTRLLAAAVGRFSPVALGSVIVLLASGVVQSLVEVRHFDLLTTTSFGRAVLIKLCLLALLIGLGALNRQRTLPRLRAAAKSGASPGGAGMILRRTVRGEVALIVVVLGVTGALASYAPAVAQYTGPKSGTTTIAGKQLQYTLDPARVGSNQLHLYLLDAKTGAQYDGAKQVTVAESLPGKNIGPLNQSGQKSGPGHYTVPDVLLNVRGTWHIQVTVLVNKFTEDTATIKVPVR